jgi:release factor glutamine methyltransferase
VLKGLESELEAAGSGAPRLEAERILCHVLGIERHELILALAEPLSPDEIRALARALARRLSGEPLQHIEGTVAFRGLSLRADGRALLPRPETEELVDHIVRWARSRQAAAGGVRVVRRPGIATAAGTVAPLGVALDIGTGSGAIALALVQEGVAERVVGVDVSPQALSQAVENRKAAGLVARVEYRLAGSSPWEVVEEGESFDLIVSNPPYGPAALVAGLPPEIREFEPREALDGGEDGLDLVRVIASGAAARLTPRGGLFMEIGEDQGAPVRLLLQGAGEWSRVEIRRDLSGRDRFAIALK